MLSSSVSPAFHPSDEENGAHFAKAKIFASFDSEFVSPMKALAFNFRFNQFFGIFPGRISEDFNQFTIVRKMILLTFSVKAMFASVILTLVYVWMMQSDEDASTFIERLTTHPHFTATDTFVMICHFFFLQFSALVLYFNNLNLGPGLTKLCLVVNEFNAKYNGSNPKAKKLMIYRISVCVLCTIASIILFTGVWRIVVNPLRTFDYLDFAIIFLIVIALYVENQNHMFSELLFLRFCDILDNRFDNLLTHLREDHYDRPSGRPCCVDYCNNIYKVYLGIGAAFGMDLLVAVAILIISITFGLYLVLTLSIFVGITNQPILFSVYVLYSIIPSLRLFVLSEGAHRTQKKMLIILGKMRRIEASEESVNWTVYESKQFALARTHFERPKGYDAAGFFFLNRKFMSTVFGSLVTYLIVLLQFKISDKGTYTF